MDQPLTINPIVKNMAPDKLLGFQKEISQIPDVLKLTFGEPGFNVADSIKQAAIKSIEANRSHYAESQGESPLRQAVVGYFNRRYHLNYQSKDQVIVTSGVTEAINVIFQTLLAPGDGLLVPEPAYGPYFSSLDLAHGVCISIDTAVHEFKLTPQQVETAIEQAQVPVKAILLNYPNNPTGVTYDRSELEALAEVFKKHQIWVISDEIYSELTYQGQHVSMAEILPEQTILLNGLSKSHAMTGYRVGFILGPEATIAEMQKVHGALAFAIPTFIQDAAQTAMVEDDDRIDMMKATYQKRRDYMVEILEGLGFTIAKPAGAFYIFAKLPADMGTDGHQFALKMAQVAKVAVIPGECFGGLPSSQAYIRLSYAASDEDVKVGLTRISQYVTVLRTNG